MKILDLLLFLDSAPPSTKKPRLSSHESSEGESVMASVKIIDLILFF